jgi:hypothetical protein
MRPGAQAGHGLNGKRTKDSFGATDAIAWEKTTQDSANEKAPRGLDTGVDLGIMRALSDTPIYGGAKTPAPYRHQPQPPSGRARPTPAGSGFFPDCFFALEAPGNNRPGKKTCRLGRVSPTRVTGATQKRRCLHSRPVGTDKGLGAAGFPKGATLAILEHPRRARRVLRYAWRPRETRGTRFESSTTYSSLWGHN